jgi:cytochrome c553
LFVLAAVSCAMTFPRPLIEESAMTALHPTGFREASEADRSMCRRALIAAAIAVLLAAPNAALATEFTDALARVDYGLRENPAQVSQFALISCRKRRNRAVKLYEVRQIARAERSLKFCFEILQIAKSRPATTDQPALSMEEVQAQAAREIEQALNLTPSIEKGLEIYRSCALCHKPEGWGLPGGTVPQLAGQHRKVVIKQLADIRAGNRDNPLMIPYASAEAIGGAQAVADVAGYIDTLEISVGNGKGPGRDLELGERLYQEHCARCHGTTGEGDADNYAPRIQAQHYKYLVRQFRWIKDGKRRNANAEMAAQIQGFKEREFQAVLDYVSRLEPPADLQAPPGWHNPDFVDREQE